MDNSVKKEIDEVLEELGKFSSNILTLNSPVNPELMKRFEQQFHVELPNDYKYLLTKTNGFGLMGDDVLGITYTTYGTDLVNTYQFEHYEVIVPQYEWLIPFCPDGGGNFYCFDTNVRTRNGDSNQIVFWYSNYEYTESDPPEVTHECLADFINECIIGWTLQDYNYDGSDRIEPSN
ncbi:SMI1/KNR4 family protein [Bacteroides heparinolyticus]|uniref:SMI1/KNR4 family protein n=1 Tax=Prevotella heparinolytica TaxID=28113 RepID=UPI0023F304DD|nr:SMI1/KNR4 family protein [Bacteroides heparinolyticus]